MNIFFYIIIFVIGTLFGSFFTLAVYRIPKKIDIISKHSFCPKCGHKLGFLELIPVFSYLFLGGKCKNCKEKIRPRYFILEILSGITFVLIAWALKIDAYNLNLITILKFAFAVLYIVAIFIIAGIDKENRKVQKGVLYYGIIVSLLYIIYLCIIGEDSIYRYVMYLTILIILLVIDSIKLKNMANESYCISILMLITIMLINTGEIVTFFTLLVTFLSIGISKGIFKIKNTLNKSIKRNEETKYKIAFLLSISNIVLFIWYLLISNMK